MRQKTLSLLSSTIAVVGFAVSLITALPATAQTPPPGSYQESCREASIVDGNLVALCKTPDAQWRMTTLANPQNCRGDIANMDGKLQCLTVKLSPQVLPPGDYQRSCKNEYVADGILLANCQMADGQWRTTTLADAANCHGSIVNANGKLECRKKSTEFSDGWGRFGGICGGGTSGTEFLIVRFGGQPGSELKIVFDEPYKQAVVSIFLPKGTTESAKCGAFDSQFSFKSLE
ncbi:MAG TPA: CVNH domain-containing protein [Thermoanaerobaculia bacterium]|jgi:hypothetical protein|nr:CVNH domain-containing protein [Thermoanaerobaculia bacterium]